ncbi:citryl-CoA lyase [Candidatus Woesearchaeota archaeon]|nr:citryl-CoA lyase [Candidatus Woesearchaeota archaeon]
MEKDTNKVWKTRIACASSDETIVRGYKLNELVDKLSFHEMIFLVLTGRLPTLPEAKVVNAILVACTEHGIAPPSITSARIIASGGNAMNTAVAGGILSLGQYHGGAIDEAARLFQENVGKDPAMVVQSVITSLKRFPGYGHKIYTTDPRTAQLFSIAQQSGVAGKHVRFALGIEAELEKAKGRKLCLNVDGAIAALISDMGIDWHIGKAFFIIPRTVGICAHVHEELADEAPFRRLSDEEMRYIGEQNKKLGDQ